MNQEEQRVSCPYCGEPLSVLIDASAGSQQYIEDCQVCCQPIEFNLEVDDLSGEFSVSLNTGQD